MNKKAYLLGMFAAGMIAFYSCNHPRTENEEPRQPEDRTLSPHDGSVSTTDSLHNDSIRQHDSSRIHNDPAEPNF